MTCNRLVVGVYSEEVKEKLLQQTDETQQKATEIIKGIAGPSTMTSIKWLFSGGVYGL